MVKPRIAIFDKWWTDGISDLEKPLESDEPTEWASFLKQPKFKLMSIKTKNGDSYSSYSNYKGCDKDIAYATYYIMGNSIQLEVHRLMQFQTCPICRAKMIQVLDIQSGLLLLCVKCGYWGGRGTRDFGHGHINGRAVIGRCAPLLTPSDMDTDYLVTHLRRQPKDLPKITPRRAEKFVMDLIRDYFACEVKAIGGSRDGGVDGYILKGNKLGTLIQVKWREDCTKAESVSIVREVAGTLLSRNVPSGLIVTNRKRYSKEAIKEAKNISDHVICDLGKINLELFDYHNILDMLEIKNIKIIENLSYHDWLQFPESICVFDGIYYSKDYGPYPDILEDHLGYKQPRTWLSQFYSKYGY